MATLWTFMDVNRVMYVAPSATEPLCDLYFCRHCFQLRSRACVSHEVDSLYCPNCLENMPASEAKIKRNRCASCFDCPSCQHALSTRATSVPSTELDPEGRATPSRKAFYLACGFCRWTSRDVAIKDQPVSSGGWHEQTNPYGARITVLLDYYHQLAVREKNEKEKKRFRHRSFFQISTEDDTTTAMSSNTEKFGLGTLAARRRSGIGVNISKDFEDIKIQDIEPSVASSNVEELSDDFLTKPLVLSQVTNISQRLASPEFQPDRADHLYPAHKHLLIKRSQRCKECDHNLSKPEFNPSSIKFKIQLVAVHHIPEIRILSLPNLKQNQTSQVILTLFNPLDFLAQVTLSPCDSTEDEYSTAQVALPPCELLVSRCDEAVEFDESLDQQQTFDDDPTVVAFRKSNKIGFFIAVTPLQDIGDVKVRFRMKHNYRSMVSALPVDKEVKEPDQMFLEHEIRVNFGSLSG